MHPVAARLVEEAVSPNESAPAKKNSSSRTAYIMALKSASIGMGSDFTIACLTDCAFGEAEVSLRSENPGERRVALVA